MNYIANQNYSYEYDFKYGTWQHFEISVEMDVNGKFFWKIKEGQEVVVNEEMKPPLTPLKRYPSVLLYLSDPNMSPFETKYGKLENLKIVNVEQEKELKPKKNPMKKQLPFWIGKK